jgi:hypothetical protein
VILLKDIIFQFEKDMGGLFNNGEEPLSYVTSGKGKKAILILELFKEGNAEVLKGC